MQTRHKAYLTEMGIDQWQLIKPEYLLGVEQTKQSLDAAFKILLVCPYSFTSEEHLFLEKVLQSFDVELNQARITQPHQLKLLGEHLLSWVWFVDCPPQETDIPRLLHSPKLSDVSRHPGLKKELWQQILANKES